MPVRLHILVCLLLLARSISAVEPAGRVDFHSQIRPILSDRCFKCHGPDAATRKAGLRLDLPATTNSTSRIKPFGIQAIVPGKPGASEVVRRITSTDPDEMMPPPESHLQISAEEVAQIRRWIEQGAEYKSHWAFQPVERKSVPKSESSWAQNPIDQFILARLATENLRPSTEATRETLIRRLSFSLTGLPPTPKKIDLFLKDTSPHAYEKLVEEYLDSPAFGEHMARDWLDLARYADTYGYQSDVERDMSAWRDWVIRAFNQNLSYDQFITWQIAGDLMRDATDEQILATAFNRLHRQTNEGGSIEEEFRNEYVADRVHTFGTAFLGLTLECARCHDHKYDPISQKDYYRLSAFFNNIDESGLYSHFTRATPSPTLLLYGEGQKEKHAALKQQVVAAEKRLAKIQTKSSERFSKVASTGSALSLVQSTNSTAEHPVTRFSFEQIADNTTPDATLKLFATLTDTPKRVEGKVGDALQFNGENSVVMNGVGKFKRTDPFSFSLWLKPTETQERAVVFHRSRSWTDSGSRGYELILQNGKPQFALVHFWPGNAIAIRTKQPLPLHEWTHLTITYDGSSRANGLRIFRNGKATAAEIVHDNLFKDIVHRAEWGDADVENIHLTLAARFRDSGFKNGSIDEFQVWNRELTEVEADGAGRNTFFSINNTNVDFRNALAELKALRDSENDFVNGIPEISVMRESQNRRPTFVLKRGAYDAPGEGVKPGTPEAIFPFAKEYSPDRLGLARWLINPKNPLPARVLVNRVWKMHFGRGLVATPEDFGNQGQSPTHPELLDWLASDLVANGWNVKRLHKLIVTSATFRQSAAASEQLLSVDPENLLLARGPKTRLSAEEVRDAALAVSGLLVSKVGGPSVKPYQPSGLWEDSGTGKTYVQDHGENLYRRSLYTFWRRTAPPPSMLTFDAMSREVCTAKRETTATPLQALVLLNDPQFVEASRVLAEKLSRPGEFNSDAIFRNSFRHVLGRDPSPTELGILSRLFDDQLNFFEANEELAKRYLATGESPRDLQLPPNQIAAMAVLINTLMNHDEFVTRR